MGSCSSKKTPVLLNNTTSTTKKNLNIDEYKSNIIEAIPLNNICQKLFHLKNFMEKYYKPKSQAYNNVFNLYSIYREIDNYLLEHQSTNGYNSIAIMFEEFHILFSFKKKFYKISFQLILNEFNIWEIIINSNHIYQWGDHFAKHSDRVDRNGQTYSFTYNFTYPEQFDKMIEYFNSIDVEKINHLKPFRKLLECEYYNKYVENSSKKLETKLNNDYDYDYDSDYDSDSDYANTHLNELSE